MSSTVRCSNFLVSNRSTLRVPQIQSYSIVFFKSVVTVPHARPFDARGSAHSTIRRAIFFAIDLSMLSSPRIQSFAIDFFSSMLKVARSLPNSSFRCSTHHIIDRSMLVAPRVQLFNAQFSSDSFNFLLHSSRTQCGPSRIERQLAATSSPVFDRKEKFDALFSGN